MSEYINEAIDVSRYAHLGEAYDKEWALKDETFRDGAEQRNIEIARRMLTENADINFISRVTSLSIDEINNLK